MLKQAEQFVQDTWPLIMCVGFFMALFLMLWFWLWLERRNNRRIQKAERRALEAQRRMWVAKE